MARGGVVSGPCVRGGIYWNLSTRGVAKVFIG